MKDNNKLILPFAFLAILIYCMGVFTGGYCDRLSVQRQAVAHGKAEYLTTESGQQVWRWKP